MKKKNIEKEIEETLKSMLVCGAEVNDLWDTYKKKYSKKEIKKLQKRIIKKFSKKFEEVFCDVDTFDL